MTTFLAMIYLAFEIVAFIYGVVSDYRNFSREFSPKPTMPPEEFQRWLDSFRSNRKRLIEL